MSYKPVFFKIIVASIFFLCGNIKSASAQLIANFTVDKTGGCSPLNVRFTNTSTGASAAATWSWNFGNGNSSALRDPGATYITAQAYTITLTVRDGANTSAKSLTVTVYKKPTVDFSVSPARGCVPLTVNFTSNATAGDGTIANYLWDFGDGGTVQGSGYSTTAHPYIFPQSPPITLNVTNSYGCYTTVTKSNQVEAVVSVVAAFTPSSLILCNAGESITFTNTSTGSGILTYKWDFGDGSPISAIQSPIHVYTTSGTFVAALTVTSSDGCAATVRSASISVANFNADFTVPAKICSGQSLTLANTSTRPFDRAEWYLNNTQYWGNYIGDLYTSFSQPGNYSIKLKVFYSNCSVETSKTIVVYKTPTLNGFITDLQGACGVPVTINFKDTSSEAVAWEWKHQYPGNTFATTQNASNTYTSGNYDFVSLTIKNAEGCSTTVSKYITYEKPNINIYVTSNGPYQGCTGLTLSFAANPDTSVTSYKWTFGDGSPISTDRNPTHVFNVAGNYSVSLEYVTSNGCTGTAYYPYVTVINKPVFDFSSVSVPTVCGNTPTTFSVTPVGTGWDFYWYFNDTIDYSNGSFGGSIIKQFRYDTTYTIKLIAVNNGCRDTIIKTNYIKVLPPFPQINDMLNTCDGTRGAMRFTENSMKALQWNWNFGDGGVDNYTVFKDTIRHAYSATGTYKLVLSAINGACTVRDSANVYVLLKQRPVLTATQASACGSDVVNFKLAGFEQNPYPFYYYYSDYYVNKVQYGDFTDCTTVAYFGSNYWDTVLTGTLQSLQPGKNDLRMITTSTFFGCQDTSNFIPLRIHGPEAGFRAERHSGCFKDPVFFTDTSHYFGNIAIVKWEWDFGDYRTQTLTTGGTVSHLYTAPGYYYIRLKITDADGCTSSTAYSQHYITVGGPKADFNASSFTVPLNSTVNFYNTSPFYTYYYYCSLKWIFSDGTTSTQENPSFLFTEQGNYPVTLITYNSQTGCTDTVQKTISVRKVNSAFTVTLSYINNNLCPPVIATFTSISTNAVRVSWDFGDGGIAGNQRVVSHTYNNSGIYRVVHYSFDSNNAVDSTEDYIEIKGPYALLKADTLYACNLLQVRLTADVKYAVDYTWDFGDGTVVPTTDTFATHNYLTPGIYVPALILKDIGGCTATSTLPEKIIVDSLAASFAISPSVICDSAMAIFTPQVSSLSNAALQSPLQYTWVANELNTSDTVYSETGTHFFNKMGNHTVKLTVRSAFGCQKDVQQIVVVKQGVNASIAGVDKLCQGESGIFSGAASPSNISLQWKWNFGNGLSVNMQNPLPQTFNTAGAQQVSLIVNNGACADTVYHALMVNAYPTVSFMPANPWVCQGSSITITASGGSSYQWTAAAAISNSTSATATATPAVGTFYFVNVTGASGCSNKDSIYVKVIAPTNVTAPPSLFACQGSTVQLNATGADKYKWINNIAGISDVNIANPSALPLASVTYSVMGYDKYNCFSDTAQIFVRISNLPIINAGADKELTAGTSVTLTPVVNGAVNWIWSPSDYLSCTTCLSPESKPKATTTYNLTAYNADGCSVTDRVTVRLLCKDNLVFIPNSFSPNGDAQNEHFNIRGSGVKSIRSIIIYNRWGKVMFERKNININDLNNSWDGTYNGEPMPAATYVYWINTECEGGDIFNFKGTVTLVR